MQNNARLVVLSAPYPRAGGKPRPHGLTFSRFGLRTVHTAAPKELLRRKMTIIPSMQDEVRDDAQHHIESIDTTGFRDPLRSKSLASRRRSRRLGSLPPHAFRLMPM